LCGLDRADRHQVGGREDCGRRLVELEERAHRGLAALAVEVAQLLVLGPAFEAERLQLGAEAEQAVGARLAVLRAGDGRDPPVTSPCRCRTARRAPPTLSEATWLARSPETSRSTPINGIFDSSSLTTSGSSRSTPMSTTP